MNKLINTEKLNDRELIMIKDLIESIGISQNTIYRICNEGSLVKYKYCGKNYWRTDEVKKYLMNKGVLITRETV